MLRGFTTAAACFVFTTQLQHIFGIYQETKPNQVFLKISFVIKYYTLWLVKHLNSKLKKFSGIHSNSKKCEQNKLDRCGHFDRLHSIFDSFEDICK